MKSMNSLLLAFILTLLFTGCMSDKEYQLRKNDLEIKKTYPSTYQPVKIKGPLTIPEGGEMIVTVPNMPYNHTAIPDGQALQARLVSDIIHTGALVGGAVYSIHKANGSTVNNYGGAK